MELVGISVEIIFAESILTLSSNLLNTNLYFRILDFAFGI